MPIYSEKQAHTRALLFDKAFIKILVEYFNCSNVFLAKNIIELLKYTKINNHII